MRSSFIPPHAIDTPLVQRQLVLFPSVLASGPAGRRTLCGRFWSTGFLDIWWPHTVSMIDVDVRAENTARKGPKRGAEKRCTTATLSFYSFFLLDLLWNVFFFYDHTRICLFATCNIALFFPFPVFIHHRLRGLWENEIRGRDGLSHWLPSHNRSAKRRLLFIPISSCENKSTKGATSDTLFFHSSTMRMLPSEKGVLSFSHFFIEIKRNTKFC